MTLISNCSVAQKSDHILMQINFIDSTLHIDAKYHTTKTANLDSIYFLLNPNYELEDLKSSGLESYKITQKPGVPFQFYHLSFNDSIINKKELVVNFKYKIDLSRQNHMKSNWIELNCDKLWYPNLNSLNNEITYDLSLENFPESYEIISHTDAIVTKMGNQTRVLKKTPWYEVLILAGENMKEWKPDEWITLIGNASINDTMFHSIATKTKNSIDLLNDYFNMVDPIKSFKVVLRNTNKNELGFQFNRNDMIVSGTDFNDYANLSHEIAHYWFNKANFIEEPWINESFANFCMYLVLREYDFPTYERLSKRYRESTKTAIPVTEAKLFTKDSYLSYYHKGAIHLITLEEKIGKQTMRLFLTSIIEKKINNTTLILTELERVTNKEHKIFFENLLNQ